VSRKAENGGENQTHARDGQVDLGTIDELVNDGLPSSARRWGLQSGEILDRRAPAVESQVIVRQLDTLSIPEIPLVRVIRLGGVLDLRRRRRKEAELEQNWMVAPPAE